MRFWRTGTSAAILLTLVATPAYAAVTRTTQDVSGEVFPCATNTYTLDGEISIVVHDSLDGQGKQHQTGTVTTTGVTATDQDGVQYAVRGAQWFGFNDTPHGGLATFTFHLNFVTPGQGTVDTVRVVEHYGPNGQFGRDTSTCVDQGE